MKPKYEVATIRNVAVAVDISMLLAEGDLYFNATDIAKPYGKRPIDWLRLQETQAYLSAFLEVRENHFQKCSQGDFVTTTKGGKYQGTWFHKDLALAFARWLDPSFAVHMDMYVKEMISKSYDWQRERLESKTGFYPMTMAILNAHENPEPYHFSNECDLINRLVLGMSSKEYRLKHGMQPLRDVLDAAQLAQIKKLQIINTGLIELGICYAERKQRLHDFCERKAIATQQGAA